MQEGVSNLRRRFAFSSNAGAKRGGTSIAERGHVAFD